MARCLAEFNQRNKTWVLLTDVDEYINSDALVIGDDSIGTNTTILSVLESRGVLDPCLSFTRHLFSAKEDYDNSTWRDLTPMGFFGIDFVTMRFCWRARKDRIFVNRWQKNIIDVSRIPISEIGDTLVNIHTPVANWCKSEPKRYIPTLLKAVSIILSPSSIIEMINPVLFMYHYYRIITLIV